MRAGEGQKEGENHKLAGLLQHSARTQESEIMTLAKIKLRVRCLNLLATQLPPVLLLFNLTVAAELSQNLV